MIGGGGEGRGTRVRVGGEGDRCEKEERGWGVAEGGGVEERGGGGETGYEWNG